MFELRCSTVRPCHIIFPLLLAVLVSSYDNDILDNVCMLQVTRPKSIVPGPVAHRLEKVVAVDSPPPVALIGVQASASVASPRDPSWFGSFSEGESTYDFDADGRGHNAQNVEEEFFGGWNPGVGIEPKPNRAPPVQWYQESASGINQEAWQTHYPALDPSIAGQGHGSRWRETAAGIWVQDFQEKELGGSHTHQGNLEPEFFDSSVNQIDALGRRKSPHPQSAKWHLDWQERTVNTTLTCADPGCMANSTLLLFNPASEQVTDCYFGLHLHPTDFDDQYSGERLEWIQVSGSTVNADCFPSERGCRADGTQVDLFSCVQDFPIDSLVDKSTGTLAVAAKISDVVDECPYQNNLLSGIPIVTCLVRPLPPPPLETDPQVPTTVLTFFNESFLLEEPLHCTERGCEAHAMFSINKTAVIFQSCTMTIKVYQTDFDGEEGAAETIEFIKLNGVELATNVAPGKNPCKSERLGTPLNEEDRVYEVVANKDITAQATSQGGRMVVEGKISPLVDECAHSGYLLDGMISVSCMLEDPNVAPSNAEEEVEDSAQR